MIISLQYLEDNPELVTYSTKEVVEKLQYSFDKLPITHLLIGWHIPDRLLEACKKECQKNKIKLFRWQPLLTGDGTVDPRDNWQVISLSGKRIPGFQNMPEFTFMCPNCAESRNVIFEHINQLTSLDIYDGLFLDRIRYPSPASHLLDNLGCFCESCKQKALKNSIDLEHLQKSLQRFTCLESGKLQLLNSLFGNYDVIIDEQLRKSIIAWLKFREGSITDFVNDVSLIIKEKGMEVGLDCFSPSLTRMVGQNLSALSPNADWIKIMSYAHTLGPAGLPFEIIDLFHFIKSSSNLNENEILDILSKLLGLPLPESLQQLREHGLTTHALELEMHKGKELTTIPILAGLELVEIPGVSSLSDDQIILDHTSVFRTGVAGLSLSWDLWHIPNHRLDLVSSVWQK